MREQPQPQPQPQVQWAPVAATLHVPLLDEAAARGRLTSPRFRCLVAPGGQFGWRGLAATIDGPADGGMLGVAEVRVAGALGRTAQFESLRWQWRSLPGRAAGTRTAFNGRIAWAVVDGTGYGPFMLDSRMTGFDIEAGRALIEWVARLRDASANRSAETPRAVDYSDLLARLLAGGATLDRRTLALETPRGNVEAQLWLAAPERLREGRFLADVIAQLEIDFEAVLATPLARDVVARSMRANGRSPYQIDDPAVDAALAERARMQLIEPIDAGRSYRLRLAVTDGRLTLNGVNQIGWQTIVDRFEVARPRLD